MSNETDKPKGEEVIEAGKTISVGMIVLFQISPGEFKPLLVTKVLKPNVIDGRLFVDSYEEEKKTFSNTAGMVGIGSFMFLGYALMKGDNVGTWSELP